MGTCFSYIKRNAKMKRRHQPHYCLTPRSFYRRDTETVELQYLVSVDNNPVDGDTVVDNAVPGAVADINENISCRSKRTCKKRQILQRLLSLWESENDYSQCPTPPTESDMMLRMVLSNSNNKVTVLHQQDGNVENSSGIEKCNNQTSNCNINDGCNVQVNSNTPCYHPLATGTNHKSTLKSSFHNNYRNISCCSSKAPSNSNSNASSIDLEWEPEGHGSGTVITNKNNKKSCQHQSSEDSVEVSLLSSAESLEWDSCEGAGVLLDSDTEQLLQEIERLTARALKETGCDCDCEFDSGNMSTIDDSYTNR